ncbi:MAG: helix-turn-helix domain-containing protein [Solirubrobacteraceae bacterium]
MSIVAAVAQALECPVAIAIPALGEPVVGPAGSLESEHALQIGAHAASLISGNVPAAPAIVADAVAVQIGKQTVGIVAATDLGTPPLVKPAADRRAWLEAAAAAASVTTLIREAHGIEERGTSQRLLSELASGLPNDLPAFLSRARRLGLELGTGAVAICARRGSEGNGMAPGLDPGDRELIDELQRGVGVLVAEVGGDQILAVAQSTGTAAEELASDLRARGLIVAVSSPRRDPAQLYQAVREAQLLAELASAPDPQPAGQEETYRLLIRVLLQDREELEQLRAQTISPLAAYDLRHDTELLGTLMAFLAHDGSTTETADAMRLHRHTVGYRLARVHEVSGLSPYESDGRERLSLGIKADQILDAERRLQPVPLNQ